MVLFFANKVVFKGDIPFGLVSSKFVSTDVKQPLASPTQTPAPFNPPKEMHYDNNTDLEKELDSVNPQILDSDFEQLKGLVESF